MTTEHWPSRRGIPLAGAYVDKGAAMLNAAAQPWLETGLSHAGAFGERAAENERTIKAATDQYEQDHPVGTGVAKFAVGGAALAPFGATALGARALGIAGEALLPSILKGATTFGLLNAGDTALRGGDAKHVAGSALSGAAGGVALPLAGKAVQTAAPFLVPILDNYRGRTTAFATHEVHPGADTGHLPGSIGAPLEERVAYASDPRATFAKAPGGRDLIYGGLSFPNTGAMRVQPTNEMTGLYTPPSGVTEVNPGWVAKPRVTLDQSAGTPTKRDRDVLNAVESYRAFVSGRNMGAWHTRWAGGPAKDSNSLLIPMSGKATPEQLTGLQKATRPQGLPDISDTGQGITVTNFGAPLPTDIGESPRSSTLFHDIRNALPGAKPQRVKVEASDNLDYVRAFREGDGSGAASRKMLTDVNVTPEIRAAMNDNPYIPQDALDRLALDQDWQSKWGVTREGLQNARRIIGNGPGWVDRIEAALKATKTPRAINQLAPSRRPDFLIRNKFCASYAS